MERSFLCLFTLLASLIIKEAPILGRSVHRPKEKNIPKIETHWLGQTSPSYVLHSSHLEEYPIFKTFNKVFFQENMLPNRNISYRYAPQKSVPGKKIKRLVESLINEIQKKKKRFSDFEVLCKKDFNHSKRSGLIILKCKHHPFVVKLSIENPKTFVQYRSKGFIPTFCFFMAGGVNRHLVGFTRIKNLHIMQKLIADSSEWANRITFPRKWFFLPKQARWIEIVGTNIGTKKTQKIAVPGTYCIISDWIDAQRKTSVFNRNDRKTCMKLCNHLGLAIDPHINNFMIESGTGKIAIVDTEHFLTLVGIKEKMKFRGYFSWGLYLAGKCAKAMFLRDKATRKRAQLAKSDFELVYEKKGSKFPLKRT